MTLFSKTLGGHGPFGPPLAMPMLWHPMEIFCVRHWLWHTKRFRIPLSCCAPHLHHKRRGLPARQSVRPKKFFDGFCTTGDVIISAPQKCRATNADVTVCKQID